MRTNVIIGSHGTGKTSLINEVQKRMSIYTSDGFSRPIRQGSVGLTELQQHIIINELTAWRWVEDGGKNCVYARSIIDSIVYTKVLFPESIDSLVKKWTKSFVKHKYYYHFFYIPIEFKLEKDGVRFEDIDLQRRIDTEMRDFIKKYQLPITTLTGSIDERADKFIETYKKLNG